MKIQHIEVMLEGVAPILFDRFIDHSKEVRPPEQKLYIAEGNRLCLPAENIRAFLSNQKTGGCAKIIEKKGSGDYIRTVESHVTITPEAIPIQRKGEDLLVPFVKGSDVSRVDFTNGILGVFTSSPVTKGSNGSIIKQPPFDRPFVKMPWTISFTVDLIENPLISENKLRNWFEYGGINIALCAYRPRWGRFIVKKWDVK